jgi:hypothetical protein
VVPAGALQMVSDGYIGLFMALIAKFSPAKAEFNCWRTQFLLPSRAQLLTICAVRHTIMT